MTKLNVSDELSEEDLFAVKQKERRDAENERRRKEAATYSRNNETKMQRVLSYVRSMFDMGSAGWIDDSPFWGKTVIEVTWENGEAKDIKPEITARDRIPRGGRQNTA